MRYNEIPAGRNFIRKGLTLLNTKTMDNSDNEAELSSLVSKIAGMDESEVDELTALVVQLARQRQLIQQ